MSEANHNLNRLLVNTGTYSSEGIFIHAGAQYERPARRPWGPTTIGTKTYAKVESQDAREKLSQGG